MRLMKIVVASVLLSLSVTLHAQISPSWTKPVEPVHIAGNIYYVGTEELGAYLIADPKGLILLDVPLEENAGLVLRNVKALGFDPKNIRILLASHAHFDHIGGLATVQERTGAKIHMSPPDAQLAARGGKGDFAFGDRVPYRPVRTDVFVNDGDVVRLGGIAMTAMHTPGHTRGCTTWRTTIEEEGRPLDVVFLCSVTAPGYTLAGNEAYPEILDDYRLSFEKLERLDPDIFLANHGGFFGLKKKLERKKAGEPNPFIARGEFARYLERARSALEEQAKK